MPQKLYREKIVRWLDEKTNNKTPVCPVCANSHWEISENALELREFNREGPPAFVASVLVGEVVPLFSLTCTSCGFTELFNAVTCGLVQ